MKKCESFERNIADQESELAKAHQSAHDARVEAQGALQEVQEARKIVAGKAFFMQRKYVKKRFLLLTGFGVLQGRLQIFRLAFQPLQSSSEPKRGAARRSYFGRNTLRQNIRYPLAIS